MQYLYFSLLFLFLTACQQAQREQEPTVPTLTEEMDTVAEDQFTFDHYAIIVEDLERASNFYLDVMGLEEIYDATEKEHIRWFSLSEKMSLHVIESPDIAQVKTGKSVHLALAINDFDGFVKKLRGLPYPFENWPGQADTTNLRPDGVEQIYFQDPDGYWIEVNDAVNF